MQPQGDSELVDLIVKWVSKRANGNGARNGKITGDTDLMESQLLDSFAFVELMMFVESQTGHKIDLTDVDPQEFAVVKGLARIAQRNGHA